MFFGIDLSHAGPQSLYQRQAGQAVTDPTVVGVCVYSKQSLTYSPT